MSADESRGAFRSGVVIGAILGILAMGGLTLVAGFLGEDEEGVIAEARETIEANYFEEVSGDELDHDSVRGMINGLRKRYDDRFSHYFTPEQLKEFEAATSGRFSGVGLTVNEVPKGLRVAGVIPDTPAEEARIEPGSLITAVNGRSIEGVPADVSTARIKGPEGTEVVLTVRPPGGGKPRDVTVKRASVRIPAVTGNLRRADGEKIAYVHLRTFSDGAHGELRDEIERLYRRGASALLLDLRTNGGGLLNEAVLASSIFVEDGTIVSTQSRTRGEREYDAVGEALDPRPMVVLVDRGTASAAEILAAAVEAHDLATIVGTRTFGKGTFQEVIGLPSGGAVDLTVGEYLTADGVSLANEGITPDVRAKDDLDTEGTDEALERALEILARELDA